MKIRYNDNWKTSFAELNLNKDLPSYDFDGDLKEIKIVEEDACFYLSFLAPGGLFSKELKDRTGNEASYNRIHIDDYLDEGIVGIDSVPFGLQYALCLASTLKELKLTFRIIVSFDGDFCNVTFHRLRENEVYLDDDLNEYKLESLCVIDFGEVVGNRLSD